MSILEYQNYRSYLRSVLAERAVKNPSYSLRAMAKSLELAPSYFSTILKGGKNLSFETAASVADRLNLKGKEFDYFCLLVQSEATKNPEMRESLLEKIQVLNPSLRPQDLTVDHFRIISDWHHFAILVATTLKNIEAKPRQLASALGISQAEVELAIERLERLEMIEKKEDGRYAKVLDNPRVVASSPNKALRNFHKQTLSKAIESLETQSPDEKIVGSETFAFDEAQLNEMRELSDEFFDRALAIAKKGKNKNQVYHLGVQLFSMTPTLKKTRRSLK